MTKTFVTLVVLLIVLVIASSNTHSDRDGIMYYTINVSGNDTTYSIFSVFGMRRRCEWEIADTMMARYDRGEFQDKDTMSIAFSQGKVLANCKVETYQKATLIDFCAFEYFWKDGKRELVAPKCD